MFSKFISFKKFFYNRQKTIVILFFFLFLLIGIFIFKDYGISWDEHIQRDTGI